MANPITAQQALTWLQHLCSQSEKCVADVRKKLSTWQISEEDTTKIVKTLLDDKYIDERRYVSAFVNDKVRFSHWGALKIQAALKAKNIAQSIISKVLEELDDLPYEDELETMLRKKVKTIKIKAKDVNDLKIKLIRFGLSRGFEYDLIYSLVVKIVTDKPDD
ncbi:MAG: RecX family transcriptional regulator [Prevotellaceae bacterium]|jgi:regulatory protein|nr:RecX family transcriptional regulator [Prevotellaceae bacterium]